MVFILFERKLFILNVSKIMVKDQENYEKKIGVKVRARLGLGLETN